MAYLKISSNQREALCEIAEIKGPRFKEVAAKLISNDNPSIRASQLRETVASVVDNEEFIESLSTQLISLASFRRVQKISSSEIFDGLMAGMEVAELPQKVIKWFNEQRSSLIQLLDSDSIRLPAKALHLSTDYENLFVSANVVTDVRPVFDSGRDSVAGAIVSQTLRVHYLGNNKFGMDGELTLALDAEDIDKLIEELEKAKKKAKSAKEHFGDSAGLEVFVVGEETYGFS